MVKQDEEAEENCCNLKDLRDGLVGKMLVRKSGRVQLILGQVTLDVSLGTTCSFFQVWNLRYFLFLCRYTLLIPSGLGFVCYRSWSLSVRREEQATCLCWAMSNTRLFVLRILRLCWGAARDCVSRVEEACPVGRWTVGSDVLLLIRTDIFCERDGLWLCFFLGWL